LIGVRIGEVESAVVASPSYLEAHGAPETPHDLASHECLRFSLVPAAREWRFRDSGGRPFGVPTSGRLVLNHGGAITRAAIAGAGLARLPVFYVEEALKQGELVEVLASFKLPPTPVHIVHPSGVDTLPKVRVFIEMLRGACTAPKKRRAPSRSR
jgi:DNA-binding transcriptional LysR family regulator